MRTRCLSIATLLMTVFAVSPSRGSCLQPDKLVLLSTTDVNGRTGPCGCHIPKGGLARRAGFADSLRTLFGQVALVDAGGFFPEEDGQQDRVAFMVDAMNLLNTDAVGVGARDLRYGASFLGAQVKRSRLPVVCANLVDARSGRPLFDPYVIKKVGNAKVGFFGLIGAKADLGPSRDSLRIEDPTAAARRTVADMRKKGADVVVLLAQLGQVDSEDLVGAIDGVNAVVVGSGAAMMQKGRMIKNTVACYGGEQGHYLCETVLTLDAKRRVTNGEAEAVMLGPDVRERDGIQAAVKRFEDDASEQARKTAAAAQGAGSR